MHAMSPLCYTGAQGVAAARGALVEVAAPRLHGSLLRRCVAAQVLQDFQENPQAAQRHLQITDYDWAEGNE